jgi:hypothetical protein
MNVARSHDSHAPTAHTSQNAGADCGTMLQECISCSSWYACCREVVYVEMHYLVLGFPSANFSGAYLIYMTLNSRMVVNDPN